MKSTDLLTALFNSPELFNKTEVAVQQRTDPDLIRAQGQIPTGAVRVIYFPLHHYEPANHGQWMRDQTPVDAQTIRAMVVRALIQSHKNFDGADVALGLDLLKAQTTPTTITEVR